MRLSYFIHLKGKFHLIPCEVVTTVFVELQEQINGSQMFFHEVEYSDRINVEDVLRVNLANLTFNKRQGGLVSHEEYSVFLYLLQDVVKFFVHNNALMTK